MDPGRQPQQLSLDEARAADVLAASRARPELGPPPREFVSKATPPLPREPGCDDGDESPEQAAPASPPEGIGPHAAKESSHAHTAGRAGHPAAGAPSPPAAGPLHEPKRCSCGAAIFWVQILDERGQRQKRTDGRLKSVSVDAVPSERGTVQVFHRPGEGIVGRMFQRPEDAPGNAILRTVHWATCPHGPKARSRST